MKKNNRITINEKGYNEFEIAQEWVYGKFRKEEKDSIISKLKKYVLKNQLKMVMGLIIFHLTSLY